MSKRVLLIEDNEHNRYLMTYLLERNGYAVETAIDGQRGLETVRSMRPDVILLDIQLPVMDGYAVARALREEHASACPPIIAVTSHAMPGDRERALAAGCSGYIEKPIQPERFIAEMERIAAAG
jgi:CheY-like chemotaxis protein